jgi:hypothetical protein
MFTNMKWDSLSFVSISNLGHALMTIVDKPKKNVCNNAISHLMIKGQKHQKHKSLIYVAYVGVYNFCTMYT